MRIDIGIQTASILVFLLLASFCVAAADVVLRFDPGDQTIPLGGVGSLSVYLDEVLDVRAIELLVTYDPGILASMDGSPGALFTESGCSLFGDWDDDSVPGQWYGGVTTLGFECYVTGPGELYYWPFEGAGEGFSHIQTIFVLLYDPDAALIAGVSLDPTHVFVGEGVDAIPVTPELLVLDIVPNPFNPSTRIHFGSASPGRARVEALDVTGRRLSTIWEGWLDHNGVSLRWDARDAQDRMLPSGVYLFRLVSESGDQLVKRGILLK